MKSALLIFFSVLFFGCQDTSTRKIANSLVEIDYKSEKTDFTAIANAIRGKDIVVLGEVGHGDGKTFEVKANLIRYLVENEGYNTLAMEGGSFLNLELFNRNKYLESHELLSLNDTIFGWMGYAWEYTKQCGQLFESIKKREMDINLIGLETQPYTGIENLLLFYSTKHNPDETLRLIELNKKIMGEKPEEVSRNDFKIYQNLLQNLLESGVVDNQFDYQVIANAILLIDIYYYRNAEDYENMNNIRDENMAANIQWYKEHHPDAKIIIWTANFHGAKSIQDIRYKKDDAKYYERLTLMTEYLAKNYKVYSIAFTSSEGTVLKETYGTSIHKIETNRNSVEYQFSKTNIEFGFVDLEKLKHDNPSFEDYVFYANILGYDNKPGKWFKSYDGIFYIKKNEPAEYIYE